MPFGYYNIADVMISWEQMGVFDYLLPFLLVFAIVYGILTTTKFLGTEKPVSVIVAVVVALLSLRWNSFFSIFLGELFPRLGVGIAILLAILILVGMFIGKRDSRYWGYGLATIAAIIAITIVYQSADRLGWLYSWGYGSSSDTVGMIILFILIAGVIVAVSASKDSSGEKGYSEHLTGWGKEKS